MNNPFDRDRTTTAASLNNPFDSSDPNHVRNRFPDISQTNSLGSPSSSSFQHNQQQSWAQPNSEFYSQFPGQQQPQFSSYTGQATTINSPYLHSNPISSFTPTTGVNPYSNPSSPYSSPGFSGGVASGGSYITPLAANPISPAGTPYAQLSAGPPGGYGGLQSLSYMGNTSGNEPRNYATNSQLAQFDPLGSAVGGAYGQQPQGYGGGLNNSNVPSSNPSEIDPGPITWYPRSSSNPNIQVVSAFGGQTTLHIPIRPHNYTPNDHPRHIISMHRAELEQWDQYGWRQSLNALENLRIAWEAMRDDIARVTDIGCPPHENAITLKVRQRPLLSFGMSRSLRGFACR